jgi:hypothetical protein
MPMIDPSGNLVEMFSRQVNDPVNRTSSEKRPIVPLRRGIGMAAKASIPAAWFLQKSMDFATARSRPPQPWRLLRRISEPAYGAIRLPEF